MDNGHRSEGLPGRDTRGNGLADQAPDPGRRSWSPAAPATSAAC